MKRDDEIAAIERWIAEHGVRRDRPAYAAPTPQGTLNLAEEAARLAAVRVEPTKQWVELRKSWSELWQRRRRHDHQHHSQGMEVRQMNSNDFAEIPVCMCGWRGCTEAYQGNQPPGWVTLIVYHAPQPVLDLTKIKDWQHDRVLCPTHAAMLSARLYPAGVDQAETPDSI